MEVYCVKQAQNGMLWFTSDRGIFNYNGGRFKTFTTQDGLGDNTNFSIYKRNDSTLWFNGYNGTLTYLKNNVFRTHNKISDFIQLHHPSDWIKDCWFTEDNIYFQLTKKHIIYRFHEPTSSFESVPYPVDGKVVKLGEGLFTNRRDSNGREKLVHIYQMHNQPTYYYTHSTWLYTAKLDNQTVTIIDSIKICRSQEPKTITHTHSKIPSWIASGDDGIHRYTTSDHQHLISGFNATSVELDQEGSLWFTSIGRGIARVSSFYVRNINSLEGKTITAINEVGHELLAGTRSGKTLVLHGEEIVQELGPTSYVPVNNIYTWGTDMFSSSAIYAMSRNGKWSPEDNSGRAVIKAATQVNDSTIYFGSSNYILHYKPGGKLQSISLTKRLGQIKTLQYFNDRLWVGAVNGLWCASFANDSLTSLQPHFSPDVFSGRIEHIARFRKGMVISILGAGLVYYNGHKMHMIRHSLINHITLINKVLPLSDSSLLLLSNTGVTLLELSPEMEVTKVVFLDESDGLNSNMVYDACVSNNSIYLATGNGVNVVTLSSFYRHFKKPDVQVAQLITNGKPNLVDGEYILRPRQDYFSVQFNSVHLSRSSLIPIYRYALVAEGTDTVWNFAENNLVRYSNVKPGAYTFLVSARNKNSVWSAPAAVKVRLKPKFTQTSGFIVLIVIISGLFAALAWHLYTRRLKRKQQQLLEMEQVNHRSVRMELFALQSQMNPHFIFNALNSIQRYVVTKSFPAVNDYIDKLAKLMRKGLQLSSVEYIPLAEEIDYLERYLELESKRFSDLFEWKISVTDDLDVSMYKIPPLLIQPLVENAIKHGFKNLTKEGLVSVVFTYLGENLMEVVIADNGTGLNLSEKVKPMPSSPKPVGITNVKKRLDLLREQTKLSGLIFDISNTPEGTRAVLILPCINA